MIPGQRHDLLRLGAEPPFDHVQHIGERRVEVVLPEVMPGEPASSASDRSKSWSASCSDRSISRASVSVSPTNTVMPGITIR